MQTLCSSGIRVSELCFVTVESLETGVFTVTNKGKERDAFLPISLCKKLKRYCHERRITSGSIFVTRSGKPIDRSNVWSSMKKLSSDAAVPLEKVSPHNLRHLFARTYYAKEKDIVRLADLLGHSNINTTRIYTRESGSTHRMQVEQLGLLFS